ncbi:MAG TPA: MBL fold metallo-hydrolase, partial [Acetobacteraceae bacterium]|nr:MBL fold metallo-hydrolase [Acetobacteraceae bacterium]
AVTGRLAVDGSRLIPLGGALMTARRRMLFNGVVVGSIAVDGAGRLCGPSRVTAPGLFEAEDKAREEIEAEFEGILADLPSALRRDQTALRESAKSALRRVVGRRYGKRPMVDVHVLQV